MGTIAEKLQKLLSTKNAIRQAIINKGQSVSENDTFSSYANKIAAIQTGPNTSDATVTATDIRSGKIAYGKNDARITGTVADVAIPTLTIDVNSSGLITASTRNNAGFISASNQSMTKQLTTKSAQTYTPGTSNQTIASGRYLTGAQTIKGDANLVPENIKDGVTIFGVTGTAKGSGAVVGTYTGNASSKVSTPQSINLGFQPKFVFVSGKKPSFESNAPWYYYSNTDNSGVTKWDTSSIAAYAFVDSPTEASDVDDNTINCLEITATGFNVANGYLDYTSTSGTSSRQVRVLLNRSTRTYYYVAIP